jgi:hypothetical protein
LVGKLYNFGVVLGVESDSVAGDFEMRVEVEVLGVEVAVELGVEVAVELGVELVVELVEA